MPRGEIAGSRGDRGTGGGASSSSRSQPGPGGGSGRASPALRGRRWREILGRCRPGRPSLPRCSRRCPVAARPHPRRHRRRSWCSAPLRRSRPLLRPSRFLSRSTRRIGHRSCPALPGRSWPRPPARGSSRPSRSTTARPSSPGPCPRTCSAPCGSPSWAATRSPPRSALASGLPAAALSTVDLPLVAGRYSRRALARRPQDLRRLPVARPCRGLLVPSASEAPGQRRAREPSRRGPRAPPPPRRHAGPERPRPGRVRRDLEGAPRPPAAPPYAAVELRLAPLLHHQPLRLPHRRGHDPRPRLATPTPPCLPAGPPAPPPAPTSSTRESTRRSRPSSSSPTPATRSPSGASARRPQGPQTQIEVTFRATSGRVQRSSIGPAGAPCSPSPRAGTSTRSEELGLPTWAAGPRLHLRRLHPHRRRRRARLRAPGAPRDARRRAGAAEPAGAEAARAALIRPHDHVHHQHGPCCRVHAHAERVAGAFFTRYSPVGKKGACSRQRQHGGVNALAGGQGMSCGSGRAPGSPRPSSSAGLQPPDLGQRRGDLLRRDDTERPAGDARQGLLRQGPLLGPSVASVRASSG